MKSLLIFVLLFAGCFAYGQSLSSKISPNLNIALTKPGSDDSKIIIWIIFSDKGQNITNYFANPTSVVSQRSLDRRKKVLPANSLLDITDLPVNRNYIEQIESLGVKIKQTSKWFNAVSATIERKQLSAIASLSFVKELDIVFGLKKDYKTLIDLNNVNPTLNSQPMGVNSLDYGASFTQNNQISVPAVHDLGFHGENVNVCILDAGFNNLAHECFATMTILATWDFVNNRPYVGDGQGGLGEGSHGTMTLSTIGGYKPGKLIGPAFKARYILAKTENTASETPIEEDNWIRGTEWADSIGVDVCSSSLGYTTFDSPYISYTYLSMDGRTCRVTLGAVLAARKGIVIVNSAGNDGLNASHNTLGAPADADSIITAGSVSSSGTRSSFSSVGNTIDNRIKPDVMAMGSSTTVASSTSTTGYTTASGTSFSCPLSAGVAAVLLSANPNLTPIQVRNAMRSTGSRAANPDREYGWGIINTLAAFNTIANPDVTPPTPITSLSVSSPSSNSLTLQWSAPFDSAASGVRVYDIRYSTTPISDTAKFNVATKVKYTNLPKSPGATEIVIVDSLVFNKLFYFSVRSADAWSNWSLLSNSAQGTTLNAPKLVTSPDSVFKIATRGMIIQDTVFISNTSIDLSTLDYSVSVINNSLAADKVEINLIPIPNKNISTEIKGKEVGLSFGQSIMGSGGPDAFGYKWIDSDNPAGPQYVWNDIASTGTLINSWTSTGSLSTTDEGYFGPIVLGFPFKFYGNTKPNLYISTNGLLTFAPIASNIFSNSSIPSASDPNEFIAPFWDDLDGKTTGSVYYKQEAGKITVQFTNWSAYTGTGALTFQIVLESSGRILYYYKTMTTTLTSATIGIENSLGSVGLQAAYNSAYIHDNLAVKFAAQPDWLMATNLSGRVANGNRSAVALTINSLDIANGLYSMDLKITSNDPLKPLVTVPVKLKIQDVLPVELVSFSAAKGSEGISIFWKTATEINNKGWNIEHKSGKSDWSNLGFINGNGTSTESKEYSFFDKNATAGKNSYRLRQVDFDGTSRLSNIVEVNREIPTIFSVAQNYPNPFNPSTTLNYSIPSNGIVSIKLFNSQGEEIRNLVNDTKEEGNYSIRISGETLSSGVYFVQVKFNGEIKTVKISLLK